MPIDERVQVAITNWAPRFISNGVDPNDFQRVTQSIERWDDWYRAWAACASLHEEMAHEAESREHFISAGYHYLHAAITYHFGKFLFMAHPTELRAGHAHVWETYGKGLPYFDFPGERVEIPYENGGYIAGILRKPWHTPNPPVVILIPGLDSVKEELHNYGDDFLKRGMAVLAMDGPGQGELEDTYALCHDYEVPVGAVIDYLQSRPDVNADRVGVMGVSLGGYYAPRAAAFEKRIKAAIANCGAYNFSEQFEKKPSLTREAFTYRLKVADEQAAREKLQRFDLSGVMEQIACPLLIIMGRQDRIVDPRSAERMAAEAPNVATLWMFEDGNHVCNNIPAKHRPQQADWMREQLTR